MHEKKRYIYFQPRTTHDVAEMRRARDDLRSHIEAQYGQTQEPVCILFDLRECEISFAHLHFTVRTLLKNEAYMRARLRRSVALVPPNRVVKLMSDLFLTVYTPVRPFSIEIEEPRAVSFLEK